MSNLVKNFTYGNLLTHSNTYTNDYELSQAQVKDGATVVLGRSYARADLLNLTGITDQVTAANSATYTSTPSNRLLSAVGPWGTKSYVYDGVGNRTNETNIVAGVTTSDTFTYPATSNRVASVVRAAVTTRALTYDIVSKTRLRHEAGNIATDSRDHLEVPLRGSGGPYTYAYNKANRLKTVTVAATVRGTYTYNGFDQLISRVITNSGTANGTTYFVHDLWGNVIAELTTAGATVREYIYLPEAEIAPTRQARAQVDRPVAVVDAVNTASPVTLMVHVDHLNRPVRMTNAAKASVWDVIYTPWGAFHSATGAQTLNTRCFFVCLPPAGRPVVPGARMRVGIRSASQEQAACITTGTGTTIRHWAATPSPTRLGLWMVRVCMRMRKAGRCKKLILTVV